EQRQLVRAGERRRPAAYARHLAPVRRRGAEQLDAAVVDVLGREALQAADLDRRQVLVVVDAGALAQHGGRADARARQPEDVALEDRARRAAVALRGDAADERGDVDPGRARGDARRVVAVEAAVGLEQRLRLV